jgi:hypothetical protein
LEEEAEAEAAKIAASIRAIIDKEIWRELWHGRGSMALPTRHKATGLPILTLCFFRVSALKT